MSERALPAADRRYEAYSHEAMQAEVEAGNDPSGAGEIGAQWTYLSARLRDSVQALAGMSTMTDELWQGAAGEAVRRSLDRAAVWTDRTARTSELIGAAVGEQAAAAALARAQMPEPVSYDPAGLIREAAVSGDIRSLVGLSDLLSGRRAEAEAARQQAVDVMRARDDALLAAVPGQDFDAPPPLTGTGSAEALPSGRAVPS
jgi:hypothetical protein